MASTPRPPWWASGWFAFGFTLVGLALLGVGVPDHGPTVPPLLTVAVVVGLGALAMALSRLSAAQQRRSEAALAAAAARDAVLSDRITIARDLHDIVSHGLGAITLRARAGLALAATDPAQASAALGDVIGLGREATDDLRRLLGVLHEPDAPAPTRPAPGLADVAPLVEAARRRGLVVAAEGLEARTDAPSTELVAYHVVREGLANAARHAERAAVSIDRAADTLRVLVTDEGPPPGWVVPPGAGHGLDLLAHRVRAHGGTLAHGPEGAGYRLEAVLPLRERG